MTYSRRFLGLPPSFPFSADANFCASVFRALPSFPSATAAGFFLGVLAMAIAYAGRPGFNAQIVD
jgi:hypothetical protein